MDLEQMFHMLDEDGGGSIDPDEFKLSLTRWMNDSKTANRFIKYNASKMVMEQGKMQMRFKDLTKKLDKFMTRLGQVRSDTHLGWPDGDVSPASSATSSFPNSPHKEYLAGASELRNASCLLAGSMASHQLQSEGSYSNRRHQVVLHACGEMERSLARCVEAAIAELRQSVLEIAADEHPAWKRADMQAPETHSHIECSPKQMATLGESWGPQSFGPSLQPVAEASASDDPWASSFLGSSFYLSA